MKIWSLGELETNDVDLTLFVSCYNEEAYIYETLQSIMKALDQRDLTFEIIVIDDCSSDRSLERIDEFIREHPDLNITVKANKKNQGLAFNFVEAAYLGKGKYYRLMCGDNAEPAEALAGIFKHVGESDMIIPYQVSTGRTFFRQAVSKTYVFLVNLISGYRLKYYNGCPVFRRVHVVRWHPHSYGFGFQSDLITRLLDEGCSYMEVESWSVENKLNLSTALTFRNFLSVVHTLIEISMRRARNILFGKHPRLES